MEVIKLQSCFFSGIELTRRPASADSTAHRQFQFQYLFISRVHLFYHIQWKRIRGIPFIVKSHNNTDNKIKMHILNQVQVNLIYNTNHNLFVWIEIFICTTYLYNATADRWTSTCRDIVATRLSVATISRRVVLPMGSDGRSLCVQISRKRSYPCHIDTTRKAIDCATTLPLNETLQQTFRPLLSKLSKKTINLGNLSPF